MVWVFDRNLANAHIVQLEMQEYQPNNVCANPNSDRPTSASNDSLNRTFFLIEIFYKNICNTLTSNQIKTRTIKNPQNKIQQIEAL